MLSQMIEIFLWPQNVGLKFWLVGCKRKRTLLICHTWLVPCEKSPPISRFWYFNFAKHFFFKLPWISSQFCCVQGPAEVQTLFLILWHQMKCHLNAINKFPQDQDRLSVLTNPGVIYGFIVGVIASNSPCVNLTNPVCLPLMTLDSFSLVLATVRNQILNSVCLRWRQTDGQCLRIEHPLQCFTAFLSDTF